MQAPHSHTSSSGMERKGGGEKLTSASSLDDWRQATTAEKLALVGGPKQRATQRARRAQKMLAARLPHCCSPAAT